MLLCECHVLGCPSLLTACCEAVQLNRACKPFCTGGMARPGTATPLSKQLAACALQECTAHMRTVCACQIKKASSGLSCWLM